MTALDQWIAQLIEYRTATGIQPLLSDIDNVIASLQEMQAVASGDVAGPAISVDNDIVLFDGVTGKLIKDSGILASSLVSQAGPTPWVPDLQFNGGVTGITYLMRAGRYIKIGSLVYLNFTIFLSNKGVDAGQAKIQGVPFAAAIGVEAGGSMNTIAGMNVGVGSVTPTISGATSELQLAVFAAGETTYLDDTLFTNNSLLKGSIIYFV